MLASNGPSGRRRRSNRRKSSSAQRRRALRHRAALHRPWRSRRRGYYWESQLLGAVEVAVAVEARVAVEG